MPKIHQENLCSKCKVNRCSIICSKCFVEESKFWVSGQDIPEIFKEEIVNGLNVILDRSRFLKKTEIECIFCFNKSEEICKDCMVQKAMELLKKYPFQEIIPTYMFFSATE
ncbi:MAG: hypothetical protein Q8Q42_04165 [Nanoarchaeota archaeon]|nr:hypothetical protein [Nanoarchaeota archaeon]